ncbi:MAG: VCBS repeat-containing protein [Alphaproteobacteria bacterium]
MWAIDGTRDKFNGFVNNGTAAVGAPGPDWHIVDTADFDSDGKGDILWRTDGGTLAIWEIDGARIKFNGFVNNGTAAVGAPGHDWHIADAADFDGDGKGDILWRTESGSLAIWEMDGARIKFNGFVNNGTAAVGAPGPDWHIERLGDYDGDGKNDMLWRTDSGSLAIWEMDGTRIKFNGFVNNGTTAVGAPGPDWHIADTADFDGDGKNDILWRTDSGSLAIWGMDGTRIKFNGFVNNGTTAVGAPGPDWHIERLGDYDGDGKNDILWRTDSGSLAIWEMDGTRIKFNGFVNNGTEAVGAPGPDWHIVKPDYDLV